MKHAHFPQMGGEISSVIETLVDVDGSAAHRHVQRLKAAANDRGARPLACMADAVHYLCMLHGRFPGVIDHAASRSADNGARHWLLQACEAFADERAYLTRLSVALGPLPSTSGHNSSESNVLQQRHALEMLSQSDRRGCAMGAAITLVLDWAGIREFLDQAAIRAGTEPSKCGLPSVMDTMAVARSIASDEAAIRAIQFGARQLLGQHRGLWDLMQVRAEIRAAEEL